MNYKIVIERKAEKEAEKIPIKYRSAVDKAILSLVSNPRPHGCKKLTGKEGYRTRVGDYRILPQPTIPHTPQNLILTTNKNKSNSSAIF